MECLQQTDHFATYFTGLEMQGLSLGAFFCFKIGIWATNVQKEILSSAQQWRLTTCMLRVEHTLYNF